MYVCVCVCVEGGGGRGLVLVTISTTCRIKKGKGRRERSRGGIGEEWTEKQVIIDTKYGQCYTHKVCVVGCLCPNCVRMFSTGIVQRVH